MGIFNILFKREPKNATAEKTPASAPKVIKTLADAKAFFVAATGDEELSKLLTEVADRIGRDGYLAVERGGTGDPYSMEYMPCPEVDSRPSEVEVNAMIAECNGLRQQIAAASSASERDQLERKLAMLAGEVCILFVNSEVADFSSRRDVIREAWAQFKEIMNPSG